MGYVYVLLCDDGKYYVGSTKNIQERVKRHSEGRVQATKGRRPLQVIDYKSYETYEEAYRVEREIKRKKSSQYVVKYIENKRHP